MADMRHDSVQTLNTTLAGLDEADLARRVQPLADSCQQRLDSAGVAFEGVRESASSWTCCTPARAIR